MKSDVERLQGVWSIVSLEVEGHSVSEGAFSGSQIVMEGDRFTTVSMGAAYGGTFTVDEEATPKTLDLLFTEGPHAGKASPAIYKLDDDCLTICLGFAGMTRPTGFVTTAGSGHALETLRRETADPTVLQVDAVAEAGAATRRAAATASGSAAPLGGGEAGSTEGEAAPLPLGEISADRGRSSDDMASLQGEWVMIAAWMDGQQLEDSIAATARRVVSGDEVTVSFGGSVFLKARFRVDATASPKTMDYTLLAGPNRGKQQLGIYELTTDTLRICYASSGHPRPTEFASRPADNRTLSEWKRAL